MTSLLPKMDVPTYELKLPSTGQEITVRPFLVKEEKLLLMAAESDDTEEIVRTTKQVINNCILTDNINVNNLPFFDVDYLFIALRAKSIGETIELQFTCNAITEDGNECGTVFDAVADISNVGVEHSEDVTKDKNIILDSTTSVKMRYPTYSVMKDVDGEHTLIDNKIDVLIHCIDHIMKDDKVYSNKDHTKEELRDFIEGLTEDKFRKLEKFIDNLPSFYVAIEKECPKCNYTHNIKYKDFQSFFY
jgi:hypothetical protein